MAKIKVRWKVPRVVYNQQNGQYESHRGGAEFEVDESHVGRLASRGQIEVDSDEIKKLQLEYESDSTAAPTAVKSEEPSEVPKKTAKKAAKKISG